VPSPRLDISNGALQGAGQVNVEERAVETVDGDPPPGAAVLVRHGGLVDLVDAGAGAARAGGGASALNGVEVVAALSLGAAGTEVDLLLIGLVLGGLGGGRGAANLGHTEDGLPAVVQSVGAFGWESKAGRDERALGPAVRNAGNVPIDDIGCCVTIKLIADINQMLYRCNIHHIDGAEIEDDGFENREVGIFVLAFLGYMGEKISFYSREIVKM
jgi:hypothetical protein